MALSELDQKKELLGHQFGPVGACNGVERPMFTQSGQVPGCRQHHKKMQNRFLLPKALGSTSCLTSWQHLSQNFWIQSHVLCESREQSLRLRRFSASKKKCQTVVMSQKEFYKEISCQGIHSPNPCNSTACSTPVTPILIGALVLILPLPLLLFCWGGYYDGSETNL